MPVKHVRRSLFLLVTALLATVAAVAAATPAGATYHYTQTPASTTVNGVRFYVVTQQDDVSGKIRGDATIDARNSSYAGRIYFVSLDRCPPVPGGSCTNVANNTTPVATNDLIGTSTPGVTCSAFGYYYISRIQYHIDGTSITGSLGASAVFLSC
jgi:hypothetical protein